MVQSAIFDEEKEEEERCYRNFVESIPGKRTRRMYEFHFGRYRKYVKDNLLPLLLLPDSSSSNSNSNSNSSSSSSSKMVEGQIIDYLISMKKQGRSYSLMNGTLSAIMHFYTMNDVVLNRKKISRFIMNSDRQVNYSSSINTGYSTEQIHKLLENSDERTKTIILVFASTGIRLAALPALKIGDLKPIKLDRDNDNDNLDLEMYEITVYKGYKEQYTTFCTPECAKVIKSYLSYRERCGEELKQDTPLVREQFDSSDSLKVKYARHVSIKTIAAIIEQKMIQAGLREIEHLGITGSRIRKDVPLIHGFRKFFNTSLMNADVTYTFKELLMGHSVKLDDFYYDQNSEKSRQKLLNEYLKAVDLLTINEENRLKLKVKELTDKADKIMELKMELDKLKEAMTKKRR